MPLASGSDSHGFYAVSGADYVSLINCRAVNPDINGFSGFDNNCSFTNCVAQNCLSVGFYMCDNLVNCVVDGGGISITGFQVCHQLTNCRAFDCTNGFYLCEHVSSCESLSNSINGFLNCNYVAASYASGNSYANWNSCANTAACND